MHPNISIVILPCLICFSICLLLIFFSRVFKFKDLSVAASHSIHSFPTVRLGGLAIILTFFILNCWYAVVSISVFIIVLPIIFIGLLEDLYFEILPSVRLIVASFSAVLCVLYITQPISHIDYFPVQKLFSFYFFSLAFTAFAIVGMINAVNMIDGLNGFSGLQSTIMLAALLYVSIQLGDTNTAKFCIILISAIMGFLILNFPYAKIFMGDTGAYSLGFVIAAIAIKLHNENPSISSWAVFLIVFWPVSDLFMSVYRRIRNNSDAKSADMMHFHHIVMRAIEVFFNRKIDRQKSNPLATIVLAPVTSIPVLIAAFNHDNPLVCFIASIIFGLIFIASYSATVKITATKIPT